MRAAPASVVAVVFCLSGLWPSAAAPAAGAFPVEGDAHEWCLGAMSSEIVPESAGHMTWKQSAESGRYDMWLSKDIPAALLGFFLGNAFSLLARVGILNPFGCAWALHPGGKGIVTAFEGALKKLGVTPQGVEASHGVLEKYGNMSSATIFFVLQRVLSSTTKDSVFFAAFGPGLTVEFGAMQRLQRA